ncbi:LysR family transcriptional regulator [Rhizobium leguminosarum bv. trifolii]|jgi:DNA-binding transcriptional LysR family regulator|uniref:HTH-type transcriptional regulator TtuA n=2 Tax=Rhizobium TaxID=379 RepID=A0AAE8QB07_9HYPH|nr:LysR family transcriptional regulator [Rhizobium ruizarguesonis]MBY5803277.1 LysR family transcriptional regulator [Rhizobium leguminosarum]NKJ75408.1 LysR family transcriptional regulator [Rhizobium leguminosarum bv. viciae]QIO43910.1 LysR family transcriptional regulator [Rhizobium leguminosarum bv. trifolii]QJS27239.1 LysR family transcriptional regulator [Rhizobium leguminosarum bv. trifolii TA1]MBC2803416.1 LysR family transcriptional regulator [Rhizobium ruizarguesonis]
MRATELSELAAFAAVARHKSFRKAGEERGVTASAISHAVLNLEDRIGIRLLNRTTRSVSLTEAGELLISHLDPAFGEMAAALDALNRYRDTPFGKVRINVPNSIGPFVIGRIIGPLLKSNPHLQLEINATDRLVDIVEEGFDAGIRFGERVTEGMIALRIKPRIRLVVVGSPAYFETRPKPATPHELKRHLCIQNMFPSGARYAWEFEKDGQTVSFQPTGPLSLDDHELMMQAALGGVGLAYIWEPRVEKAIASGELIKVLDDWCQPEEPLYLYYPSRRHMSAGFRAVIDAMRAE